jgi:hypothetical protein
VTPAIGGDASAFQGWGEDEIPRRFRNVVLKFFQEFCWAPAGVLKCAIKQFGGCMQPAYVMVIAIGMAIAAAILVAVLMRRGMPAQTGFAETNSRLAILEADLLTFSPPANGTGDSIASSAHSWTGRSAGMGSSMNPRPNAPRWGTARRASAMSHPWFASTIKRSPLLRSRARAETTCVSVSVPNATFTLNAVKPASRHRATVSGAVSGLRPLRPSGRWGVRQDKLI